MTFREVALVVLGLASATAAASATRGAEESSYAAFDPLGSSLPSPGSALDRTIDELESRVVHDQSSPLVRAELGVAWRRNGTIEARLRAVRRFEEALDLAECAASSLTPGQRAFCAHCWLALGLTRVEQGFESYGGEAFRKAIGLVPDEPRSHLELGLHYFRDWRFSHQSHDPNAAAARRELLLALDLPPGCEQAGLPLMVLARMCGDAEGVEDVVIRMLARDPASPMASLLQGIMEYDAGRGSRAGICFDEGLARAAVVDSELAEALGDISILLPGDSLAAYRKMNAQDRRETERRFWQARDPTPTTPENERRLEHCVRVLTADALYDPPASSLRGFATTRGRAYVRYGLPDAEDYDPGFIGAKRMIEMELYGAIEGMGPKEIIEERGIQKPTMRLMYSFPDTTFVLTLEDLMLQDSFVREVSLASDEPGRPFRHWGSEMPERSRWQYPGNELPLVAETYRFLAPSERIHLAVIFALPPWLVQAGDGAEPRDLRAARRLAVFDSEWNRIANSGEDVVYRLNVGSQSPRGTFFADCLETDIPAGDYHLALEVEASDHSARALWHRDADVAPLGPGDLRLSDVVFASRVEPANGSGPLARGALQILPRPGRRFAHGEGVTFYYEIYGLVPEADGETQFRVRYHVNHEDPHGGLLGRVQRLVGLMPKETAPRDVTYGFERSGVGPESAEYLTLDSSDLPSGRYRLTIEVEDTKTGKSSTRTGEFEMIP